MRLSLLALGAIASVVVALPAPSTYVLHERRSPSKASAWTKRNRVHGDVKLPMRIGLTQSNLHNGHEYLMDVADPESSNYGKYYTANEVIDLFAPAESAVDTVRAWLESSGIDAERASLSVNKQWLQFDARSSEAEGLFQTK